MAIAANIGDVAVLDFEACFPDSVVGLIPNDGVLQDFLYCVLRAMKPDLMLEAPVNTQGNLSINRLNSMAMAVPPEGEQQEIVDAIGAQTVWLDDAAACTRREIALIIEYRTRLISDVVTGRLDIREVAVCLPDQQDEPELVGGVAVSGDLEVNDVGDVLEAVEI